MVKSSGLLDLKLCVNWIVPEGKFGAGSHESSGGLDTRADFRG